MQADAYFDTQEEALKAVQGRRAELRDEGMIVRWEKTGYDNGDYIPESQSGLVIRSPQWF